MKTKKNLGKRALSILLTLLTVLSLVPMSVFSTSAMSFCIHSYENGFCIPCGGFEPSALTTDKYDVNDDGEKDIVYEISNAGQLYWFADKVKKDNANFGSANAVLTGDIVVNENVPNEYGHINNGSFREWTPIGDSSYVYSGIFDGQNHSISGLYFNDSSRGYFGLFGYVDNGTVKNIGVTDSYIFAAGYVGGVCAEIYASKVINCYNTGKIKGEMVTGGVVGVNKESEVINCYNTGEVRGYNAVGGVVGFNTKSEVTNCYNTGKVTGRSYIGGVIGDNHESEITNCYYLIGSCEGGINGSNVKGSAEVKAMMQFKSGGVAYLLGDAFGQKIGEEDIPILGSDKVYMITNCNNEIVYRNINSIHGYKNGFCADCNNYEPATYTDDKYDVNDDGEKDIVYEISNGGQLYWFADKVNNDNANFGSANAVLTADIVVNENVLNEDENLNYGNFREWMPIGDSSYGYSGIFDGQNHSISGLYVNDSFRNCVGLFGYVDNSTVKNTGVTDSYFSTGSCVGGVCGGAYASKVINCYNTGAVKGDFAGGVVGSNSESDVTNCYNTGSVHGGIVIGGVVGYNYKSDVTNCYNTGEVDGFDFCGALIGDNHESEVTNFSKVTNCYYLDTVCGVGISGSTEECSAEAKTIAQFKSGEIAYLLQGEQTEEIWGQKIGTDEIPVIGGDKVYFGYTDCIDTENGYSNTKSFAEKPAHNYANGFCTVCDGFESSALTTDKYDVNDDGEKDIVYEISNAGQLYWFADKVNNDNTNFGSANAVLTADIVVNENVLNEDGNPNDGNFRKWTPIGASSYRYSGIFDGQNHSVSGLFGYFKTSFNYVGLFGYLDNAAVKNTGVTDSFFYSGVYAGGVCGYAYASKVINCYNRGVILDTSIIGGVVGEATETEVINCYNTGAIRGFDVTGGVIGEATKTEVINCYNTGAIQGFGFTGGVIGINDNNEITNCYYLNTSCKGGINGSDVEGSAEAKTIAQFKSGEVAYLLGDAFGQKIGEDDIPVPGGVKVYYGYTSCEDTTKTYTNKVASDNKIEHTKKLDNTVSENVIIVSCTDCDKEIGKLTLTAPSNLVYNGEAKSVTVDAENLDTTGIEITYTGDRTNVTEEGFTASITFEGVTAELNVKIQPKELTLPKISTYYCKDYDGTNILEYFEANVDGFLFYDEGDYVVEDVLDYDDVYDDVSIDTDTAVVTLPGVLVGEYTTATISGITLKGEDADNYTIADEFKNIPLEYEYGTFSINPLIVYITPEDQVVPEGQDIDKNAYTFDTDIPEGHTIICVELEENDDNTISVKKDEDGNVVGVTVTNADGVDVTNCFEFYSYEYANLTRTHAGHTLNEDGFCATGECENYDKPVWNEDIYAYEIYNAGQLYWFVDYINTENNSVSAVLMNDILVPDYAPIWVPADNFCGEFNGNFYTISGINCVTEGDAGLFGGGNYAYGTIKNLHLTESYFEGYENVGGIAGYFAGTIENCYVTDITLNGGNNMGALVGYNAGSVLNCFAYADTLVGFFYDGYGWVENSYYLAEVETEDGGKTEEQFASGEVAYLLQAGIVGEDIYDDDWNYIETIIPHVWGQTIGTDKCPVFGGDKIYYGYESCVSTEKTYSNKVCYDEIPPHNHKLGDVDLDGIVTIRDVSTLSKYIAGIIELTECQVTILDADQNGIININDATHIQRIIAEYV